MGHLFKRKVSPTEPGRILVVDDDENVRATVLEALSSAGMEAESSESGEEGLKMLGTCRYDAVLLDVRMPGVNGMEVLKEMSRSSPDTPVILVTAYGSVEGTVEAMRAGAANVIEKPFTPEEIRSVVLDALERAKTERLAGKTSADYIHLAKSNLMKRRLEWAAAHACRALALDPSDPEPFNILGVVMQLKMDVAEAQKYFRSALALDEGFIPARKNLENLSGFPKELSHFELYE